VEPPPDDILHRGGEPPAQPVPHGEGPHLSHEAPVDDGDPVDHHGQQEDGDGENEAGEEDTLVLRDLDGAVHPLPLRGVVQRHLELAGPALPDPFTASKMARSPVRSGSKTTSTRLLPSGQIRASRTPAVPCRARSTVALSPLESMPSTMRVTLSFWPASMTAAAYPASSTAVMSARSVTTLRLESQRELAVAHCKVENIERHRAPWRPATSDVTQESVVIEKGNN
jgi:hypothetical protein